MGDKNRPEFHVVIYDDKGHLVGKVPIKGRNAGQAAADAMGAVDGAVIIDRVTVDGEVIVRNGEFKPQIKGKQFKRTGNQNFWARVPIQIIRTVRRLMPERSKSWFVSDAIAEKLDREKDELEQGLSKYQK